MIISGLGGREMKRQSSSRGRGQFSYFHALGVGSRTQISSGPARLCRARRGRGHPPPPRHTHRELQLVRGRDSSPTLMISEPALPPATDSEGWEKGWDGGRASLPCPYLIWQMRDGARFPMLTVLMETHLCPSQQGQLCCAA